MTQILYGPYASIPAVGTVADGTIYNATDRGTQYLATDSSWQLQGTPSVPSFLPGFFAFPAPSGLDLIFMSPWGVNSTGQPYYDPAGAASGEAAYLTLDPATGSPELILFAGQ